MKERKPTITAHLISIAILSTLWMTDWAIAQRPKLPPAGDCKAMASTGSSKLWYGEFSGRYEDPFRDGFYYPVAARGCFTTERECRRWTNQLLSITESSGLMSCRPYGKKR